MNAATLSIFALVTFIIHANLTQIRSIPDAVFVPLSRSNFTFVHNISQGECLCLAIWNFPVINYFDNSTCQLFSRIPCSYQIRLQAQARLYIFDASVPVAGGSCTANLSQLTEKLNNTVPIDIPVIAPRCLITDDHGYLVTVRDDPSFLERYDPINLTLIDRTSLTGLYPLTLAFRDGAYYIGTYYDSILIINSTTLTMIDSITSSYLFGPRDIIFINDGYTMVVASTDNNLIVFFNHSDTTSTIYTFADYVPFSHQGPHGLWRVNDSFFYVTSYTNNTIWSYSADDNRSWAQTLVVDASPLVSTSGGTHVTVDQNDRLWFSLENGGALIYDTHGVLLGTFGYSSVSIYDIYITENYVLYVSSYLSDRLLRFDPQIY